MAKPPAAAAAAASGLAKAILAGNVNLAGGTDGELVEISAATRAAQLKHAESLLHVEARRRQRTINVPTREDHVRVALRALGQPITLFGERLSDRRERLKLFLAGKDASFDVQAFLLEIAGGQDESGAVAKQVMQAEAVHTPVSDAMLLARQILAKVSWERARTRLIREANQSLPDGPLERFKMSIVASQIGDRRPLSSCALSPNADYCVVGSWSESCKVWRLSDFSLVATLLGHTDRIVDAQFRPVGSELVVASGSADSSVRVWRLGDLSHDALGATNVLQGHLQRVARVAWDVTGDFIASTSYDHTWRLWDAETGATLLEQDGHARQVYALGFHPDGALVCTGDLGGVGRVWDIRSSRTVMPLQGHLLGVLACDFHMDGWRLATGGLDNQVRVWDLRKGRCLNVLPFHAKTVSQVKWASQTGSFLATASHDRTVRMWSCDTNDYRPLSVCEGHEAPIFGLSMAQHDQFKLLTCSYDRTFKLWGMTR